MFNRAIEIHDSVLEGLTTSQAAAELHFSRVYIHQTQGEPGIDSGTVWIQKAILRILGATVHGGFSEFPVDLHDGEIILATSRFDNAIPIPIRYEGKVELRLEAWGRSQEVVTLVGNGAELELVGQAEYLEEFRP